VNKGWKARYFCARNQSDNYAIDYYENDTLSKKKGTIQCCGCRTEEFSAEEEEGHGRHGKHGIKITPADDDGRVWWLRCENEDEKADWVKIFMSACQKALPPVHPDPVVATAFQASYKALRWRHGLHGWYRTTYTESEHLARLCSDIISRQVMHAACSAIPESNQKAATVNVVLKNVDAAVTAAADKAWSACLASCASTRPTLEAAVRSQQRLPALETELTELVINLTKDSVRPFLLEARQRMCVSILRSCESPVTNAFVTTVHGFHDYMAEQIREKSFEKAAFQANIILSHRSVEEWWSGPLEETNQVCWVMYTDDLTDISSFFVAGYSAYNLYSQVLDANRKLMHRALSFFSKMAAEVNYVNLDNVLKQVLYFVINDAKVHLKTVLCGILLGFLQSSFEADVVMPFLQLVQSPLQCLLDGLSDPGLAELVHPPAFAERVLWGVLNKKVTAMVEASHADNCAEIDTTVDQVGAVAPSSL
jgi:hypothetical protein